MLWVAGIRPGNMEVESTHGTGRASPDDLEAAKDNTGVIDVSNEIQHRLESPDMARRHSPGQ